MCIVAGHVAHVRLLSHRLLVQAHGHERLRVDLSEARSERRAGLLEVAGAQTVSFGVRADVRNVRVVGRATS